MSRTNIVFIHTDSMDGRAMGCMGHPAMQKATPNLDRLAREGVLFRNTYSNNPVCCPSRASMFSGQFTHHCEGWNNHKGLSEADPTFLDALSAAGYRIKILGKTDFLSGRHTIRARVSPWTRSANMPAPHYRMPGPEVRVMEETRVHHEDWSRIDQAIEWMRTERPAEGSPFLLYLSLALPHPGFLTSEHYLRMIDADKVELPPADESSHPVLEYQRTVKNWMHGFDDDTVRLVRRIYFAMIAEVDAMVGRIMETLAELGLDESTMVVFSSDHGELAMEHRQFYKMSPYEPAVRVPLIVRGPEVHRNLQIDELVSLVDLFPTFMDMAQLACPEGLDGHSLMPCLQGHKRGVPDWVLSEFHGSTCSTGVFMLRQGAWKYIAYVGYAPQLFDLDSDPWEVHNKADEEPERLSRMDGLLRSIVDYESVDAKVKAYDRESFRAWREEHKRTGDYKILMGQVHAGWDYLENEKDLPWPAENEQHIEQWLNA